ncbi:HpcH/HpaI aldolase family protein [Pandoraea anhela]|uniref:4-hydroxy-2-oxo-heptane-1,7-dioate aldolase n=1 Tax=Pandoraea anhela TaxID=2508295 RepID=A0A5E4W929_9BURK|nr:HpcH/HpaI aldolase/citrate lyase family protein [Pandoraea anhela]VVE21487.1 4-hydroxy-2-oxo-heptane-1,7-dioate aldolase [Pandoraea anhela]
MQPNRFKAALQAGRQQIGIWSMLADSNVVEVLTQSDFDWILIDTEHSPNELPMVQAQLRTAAQKGVPALVRVSSNDAVVLKRTLDIGAQTVLVPMIEDAAAAARAVAAVRYPPHGMRGVSLATRANRYGTDIDYLARANDEVCLLLQIETATALRNLDAIAAVPGVDGLFIGPSDLAASMGYLGNFAHGAVQAAIQHAQDRCHAVGMPVGTLMTDQALAARYLQLGFDYVAVATDIGILRSGAEQRLAQAKDSLCEAS